MKNIILVGAGGHAKSCIDVIENINLYNIVGLIDLKEKIGEKVFGYSIIDSDDNISKYVKDNLFLITLGQIHSAARRKEIFFAIKKLGGKFATIISNNSYVSNHAKIGEGTIIMSGAFVNAGVCIGENCIINTNALLEHDVEVGNNCHISTSSVINGDVKIGNDSFVGSNATVVQGVHLPDSSFIKAGSLKK